MLSYRCVVIVYIGVVYCLFAACGKPLYLEKGDVLHNKTELMLQSVNSDDEKGRLKEELYGLSKPKPNAKGLGVVRYKLWAYYFTLDEDKGIGEWINRKLGEPPILVDTSALDKSSEQMQRYLFKKGYFDNEVDYQVNTKGYKATVKYVVKLNEPYRINEVVFPQDTSVQIQQLLYKSKSKSLLKKDQRFEVAKLDAELNRIVNYLQNRGFYDFNRKYLKYDLDSSKQNRTIDIYLRLKTASLPDRHEPYRINNVYINSEYDAKKDAKYYTDTTRYYIERLGKGFNLVACEPDAKTSQCRYYYISSGKPYKNTKYSRSDTTFVGKDLARFKPETLLRYLLINPDGLYSRKEYNVAMNHFLDLGVFKFVNIKFEKKEKNGEPWLDCFIYLTPSKNQSVSAEMEVNNRSESRLSNSLLGIAVGMSYTNRNVLRGAENFNTNFFSGLEFNLGNLDSLVNTLDISGEFNLRIPNLIPMRLNNLSTSKLPYTNVSLNAHYLQRFDYYTITSYNLNFGYDWHATNQTRHIFNPISIGSLSLLNRTDSFQEQLDQNPFLAKSFEEQLIAGGNYTLIYTNQKLNQFSDFKYFRGSIELAGNVFFMIEDFTELINKPVDVKLLGNDYSQYIRAEGDFRQYWYPFHKRNFLNKSILVFRAEGGAGLPYQNSRVLPYVKQFFVGGTNSIRAFKIRSIGPGSFGEHSLGEAADSLYIDEFDRTGDLKLEFNLEYRFDISSFVKGAFFVDAGNVWALSKEVGFDPITNEVYAIRPGGSFEWNTFVNEFAVGVGYGLRLDFSYFVMRFDAASAIRNPSLAENNRWVKQRFNNISWIKDNVNLNLAIGYPF